MFTSVTRLPDWYYIIYTIGGIKCQSAHNDQKKRYQIQRAKIKNWFFGMSPQEIKLFLPTQARIWRPRTYADQAMTSTVVVALVQFALDNGASQE